VRRFVYHKSVMKWVFWITCPNKHNGGNPNRRWHRGFLSLGLNPPVHVALESNDSTFQASAAAMNPSLDRSMHRNLHDAIEILDPVAWRGTRCREFDDLPAARDDFEERDGLHDRHGCVDHLVRKLEAKGAELRKGCQSRKGGDGWCGVSFYDRGVESRALTAVLRRIHAGLASELHGERSEVEKGHWADGADEDGGVGVVETLWWSQDSELVVAVGKRNADVV
jgi:hypothetical protein